MFVTIKTKGNFAHQEAEIRGGELAKGKYVVFLDTDD